MNKQSIQIGNMPSSHLSLRQFYKLEVIKALLANRDFTDSQATDFVMLAADITNELLNEDQAYDKLCTKIFTEK